jgi:hypothetical protein
MRVTGRRNRAGSSPFLNAGRQGFADLALMRRIDELHLDYPFAGARMLRALSRRESLMVARRHVATPMKRMGIEARSGPLADREHAERVRLCRSVIDVEALRFCSLDRKGFDAARSCLG